MMPGNASGSVIDAKTHAREPPNVRRRRFEAPVDGLDRQANRTDHQREAHDRRRERGAGPAEREDDSEPFVEQAADRSALAEEHEKREADDDRRQHERQMHDGVDQDFAGEPRAREHVGDENGDRQAADDADDRDPQAEKNDADSPRGSIQAIAATSVTAKPYLSQIGAAAAERR